MIEMGQFITEIEFNSISERLLDLIRLGSLIYLSNIENVEKFKQRNS